MGPAYQCTVSIHPPLPCAALQAGTTSLVLRKKPPGKVLPSAHAVEREYQVLRALQPTPVPVPRVAALCDDPGVIGTPFYVMEHVKGRIFDNPTLPGCSSQQRAAIYRAMAHTLAALHSVQPGEVGLGAYGKPSGYNRRQVWRWAQQYLKSVQASGGPGRLPVAGMCEVCTLLSAELCELWLSAVHRAASQLPTATCLASRREARAPPPGLCPLGSSSLALSCPGLCAGVALL